MEQPTSGITARMPEHYDLTLLDPDNKLGRGIAMMRAEIEELHAKLARVPTRMELARAAVDIIFCTAVTTTFLNWWLLAR
jgi:hypothetical protein